MSISSYDYDTQRGDSTIDIDDLRKIVYEMENDRDSLADEVERLTDELAETDQETDSLLFETLKEELKLAQTAFEEWVDEWQAQLDDASTLCDEVGRDHSSLFSADSDLGEIAREFAEDIEERGIFNRWPFNCIDWEQAGELLRHDWSSFDYAGESYYGR